MFRPTELCVEGIELLFDVLQFLLPLGILVRQRLSSWSGLCSLRHGRQRFFESLQLRPFLCHGSNRKDPELSCSKLGNFNFWVPWSGWKLAGGGDKHPDSAVDLPITLASEKGEWDHVSRSCWTYYIDILYTTILPTDIWVFLEHTAHIILSGHHLSHLPTGSIPRMSTIHGFLANNPFRIIQNSANSPNNYLLKRLDCCEIKMCR